jgi:hypothetical protein
LVQHAEATLALLPASEREWIFSGTALTLYPALKK